MTAVPSLWARIHHVASRLDERRWAHLCVVNLRLLLGFAFIPAGLKKVLAQPFTAPENVGPFHDFLRAFHATGFFYQFVGALQLFAALLLLSQRFAIWGALLLLPLLTAILVFCWSTAVYPTAIVVTLMFLGTLALLLWELPRWWSACMGRGAGGEPFRSGPPRHDPVAWSRCGFAILALYALACAFSGEIYRPRGAEWGRPAFYFLVLIALCPIIALVVERRRLSRGGALLRARS